MPDSVVAWDIQSGKMLRRLEGFSNFFDRAFSLAWSPDGNELAIGTFDAQVFVWNRSEHQYSTSFNTYLQIGQLEWSPDGDKLLGSGFSRVEGLGGVLWDVNSDTPAYEITSGNYVPFVWLAEGTQYINGELNTGAESLEYHLLRHEVSSDTILWDVVVEPYTELAVSGDEKLVALGVGNRVVIRDAANGNELLSFPDQGSEVVTIELLPDHQRLITGTKDGSLVLWDAQRGEIIQEYDDAGFLPTVSPDGTRFAYGTDAYDVRVRGIGDGYSTSLTGHRGKITSIAWSPDGLMLATASEDVTVRFWALD
jgi:WD40 repeat protein